MAKIGLHWVRAIRSPAFAGSRLPHRVGRGFTFSSTAATTASSSAGEARAAALIIGDEVLAGSTVDTNSPWLCKLLHNRGIDMVRMEFVGDNAKDIQDSILRMKEAVGPNGIIFTSGGIGPTHDDVTYDAIAGAFGRGLAVHPETLKRMTAHYATKNQEVNESRLRMATLPERSDVLFCEETWVPLVVVEGVHILPGIPRLFQMMLSAQEHRFQGAHFHAVSLFTSVGEGVLAKPLGDIALRHPAVRIGSYPKGQEGEYTVKLMVDLPPEITCTCAGVAVAQIAPPEFQCKKPQFQHTLYQECGFLYLLSQWTSHSTIWVSRSPSKLS